EAAPTPTSDGPAGPPVAPIPWQDAQLALNNVSPSAMLSALVYSASEYADAELMLEASEYRPPVSNRPSNTKATPTMGWRRFCESAFTLCVPYVFYNRMRCDKSVPVTSGAMDVEPADRTSH